MNLPRPAFDVPRAAHALRALLQNPDDLPQVFTLIESLSGFAAYRLRAGFRSTESGRRILRDRPDIVSILGDRQKLRAMPAGSLGRAYLAFVESEGISAQGIRDASEAEHRTVSNDPDIAFIRNRMRDTHDVWHAATGYRGDVLGELALLAFNVGQHWNTAIALIVVAAILKGIGRTDLAVVLDGYRRGRKAAWLPSQDWESLLEKPLDEVRALLKLGTPPEYTPVRSDELRAQGIITAT
jgi:ubiquinone biosynthesis protein COQ4